MSDPNWGPARFDLPTRHPAEMIPARESYVAFQQATQILIKTIDLSVPRPTLTLVAQHPVVMIVDELCADIDAEHALSLGVKSQFPCSSGAFAAPL
jgi:hypothetical protein